MKIIFLGSQGSGKSTQAKLAAKKLKLPVIEMGQLFRDKAASQDSESFQIKRALEVGVLVPDEIAIKTLQSRISQSDCGSGYILDGYPRNYAQIEGLEKDIDKVFYIKVSDQEGIQRLIRRARDDDNLPVVTKRLQVYHELTEPLLSYFRQRGILEEINGDRTIEEVAEDIERRLEDAKVTKQS